MYCTVHSYIYSCVRLSTLSTLNKTEKYTFIHSFFYLFTSTSVMRDAKNTARKWVRRDKDLSVVTVVADPPILISPNPPYELYIPWLNSNATGVDGQQVGVLE